MHLVLYRNSIHGLKKTMLLEALTSVKTHKFCRTVYAELLSLRAYYGKNRIT